MSIKAENLVWKIGRKTILDGVSFEAKSGKMLGLLGPNGSGKTSLLRLLAGLKQPNSGRISLDLQDIGTIGRRTIAQRVAFVAVHLAPARQQFLQMRRRQRGRGGAAGLGQRRRERNL